MERKQAALELLALFSRLAQHRPTAELQVKARGEALALHLAAQQPQGVTPGELREAMGISAARVAAILGTLEDKGLIQRLSGGSDRRRIRVVLTPAGLERNRQNFACIAAHMEQVLSALDDQELTCFLQVLYKLEDLYQTQSEETIC